MAELDALNLPHSEATNLVLHHVLDSEADWAFTLRQLTTLEQFDRLMDEATELFKFIAEDVLSFEGGRYHINRDTLDWHLDHGSCIIDRWSGLGSSVNDNTFMLDNRTFWSMLHLGELLQQVADNERERRIDSAERATRE